MSSAAAAPVAAAAASAVFVQRAPSAATPDGGGAAMPEQRAAAPLVFARPQPVVTSLPTGSSIDDDGVLVPSSSASSRVPSPRSSTSGGDSDSLLRELTVRAAAAAALEARFVAAVRAFADARTLPALSNACSAMRSCGNLVPTAASAGQLTLVLDAALCRDDLGPECWALAADLCALFLRQTLAEADAASLGRALLHRALTAPGGEEREGLIAAFFAVLGANVDTVLPLVSSLVSAVAETPLVAHLFAHT